MTFAPEAGAGALPLIPQFTVGDRLRKARETTGLDRQAFATEIGVSRNSLYKYESSDEAPRQLVLMAWSMRTGVPIEWLRTGQAPVNPVPPAGFEPATVRLEGRVSVVPLRRRERRSADRTLVAERAA